MRRHAHRGVTIVEIAVVLAITAMLILFGAPTFSDWIMNLRIRSTAESVLSGLQLAKSEAVSRNARVRFQLTNTLDAGCILSATGANWVVNLDPNNDAEAVENRCDGAIDDQAEPFLLQTRPAAAGSGSTTVNASAATVVFSGLGRPVPAPAGNITIDFTNPLGGACAADGGNMTCLRIVISPVGQIRMCNPAYPGTDPQAC